MAKANKTLVAPYLLECPVCLEILCAPIYQCETGHSLCYTCTQKLQPPICPICRHKLTQMRNLQLEEIVATAKVSCPNKSSGCAHTMMPNDSEEHFKECIFREMNCPLGVSDRFGKCSWKGKLKDMMDHFKVRHAAHCNITTDEEVELTNIDIKNDHRHVYLVAQTNFLFIITVKIDSLKKMVYWTIQHIGSKKAAHDHIYEIHVMSKQNPRNKIVLTEHCFNDAIKPEEIYREGKCAVLPLAVLVHYIKDKKMTFRFFIKRISSLPAENKNDKGDSKNDNKPKQGPGPKGPGPKGPGPKGPGPKGPGPKEPKNAKDKNKQNGAGPQPRVKNNAQLCLIPTNHVTIPLISLSSKRDGIFPYPIFPVHMGFSRNLVLPYTHRFGLLSILTILLY